MRSTHALRRAEEEDITLKEVKGALVEPDLVENYVDDVRGRSCLLLGYTKKGRPLHIVCSPRSFGLIIITNYEPKTYEWEADYKRRRRG